MVQRQLLRALYKSAKCLHMEIKMKKLVFPSAAQAALYEAIAEADPKAADHALWAVTRSRVEMLASANGKYFDPKQKSKGTLKRYFKDFIDDAKKHGYKKAMDARNMGVGKKLLKTAPVRKVIKSIAK